MTFDVEQTAREAGCWLLGHDPQPKWNSRGGGLDGPGVVEVLCRRCELYVPSREARRGPVWRRVLS